MYHSVKFFGFTVMNKLEFMRLWDSYSELLTPTQREITNLYFNLDLTLSEIAAEKGISRQAVSDCLNGCKRQLAELENKLKVVENGREYGLEMRLKLNDVTRWAEAFKAAHSEFEEEINQLEEIVAKDYSSKAAEALGGSDSQTSYEK